MILQINQRKKLKQQEVEVQQGLTVLVGTNGSGKSSFLESLFFNHILRDIRQQSPFGNCIVYSSGVNESFTPLYQAQLKVLYNNSLKLVSSHDTNGLNSRSKYYFSKEWAPFILLASTFLARESSNTIKWMNHFNLKTAYFEFEIYLPSSFKKKLRQAYRNIEEGRSDYGFESSQLVKFVNILVGGDLEEKLAHSRLKISWGDKHNLESHPRSAMNTSISNQIFDTQLFASLDETINPVDSFFQMLQVLSFGGNRTKYISLDLSTIVFSRENQLIGLHDLSDGEFQILLNSALLDLFDQERSLFLLDEIDAHIHSTMIKKVWSSFEGVRGYVFTTSHNLLTISNSDYNRIIFLEDGTIITDSSKKIKLVDDICGTLFGGPVFKSLLYSIENVVLIDDHNDWEIYKTLLIRMGRDVAQLESNLLVLKRNSGTDVNERSNLISPKRSFVDEIKLIAENNSDINSSQIKLKNIFFICDSDAYVFRGAGLDRTSESITIKGNRININSFIWNRRYIESYLISPTARVHDDASPSVEFIWGELDNFGPIAENLLNTTSIKRVKCKEVIKKFIITENQGFDKMKLSAYISRMNINEIDPYLGEVFDEIINLKNT